MKLSILMVDDNKDIIELMTPHFKLEEYHITVAYDGLMALELFKSSKFDLILLDVMMPKMDGMTVCKKIRSESDIPIIMITAKTQDEDVIMGLDVGADDYIVKPFSPKQVIAKIKALMRRLKVESSDAELKISNLDINMRNYTASIDNHQLVLTKKEMEILYLLAQHPSRVYSREILLDMLWGDEYFGDIRTVDTHIKRLRAKICLVTNELKWDIKTVWGVGYKFEELEE